MCLRGYERVICVSEDVLKVCLESGVPEHRCVLVENAIDLQEYSRSSTAAAAKERLGLDVGRLLIRAARWLSSEKGFDVLIRAVNGLLAQGLNLQLVIAGQGKERARLQALIDGLERQDRMRLVGHRADMIELYEGMDLFALSSLREGLPNVVLEAMAMQVPVVATRVAGVPRLISDGENGLLIESASVDALTRAIERCCAIGDAAHQN